MTFTIHLYTTSKHQTPPLPSPYKDREPLSPLTSLVALLTLILDSNGQVFVAGYVPIVVVSWSVLFGWNVVLIRLFSLGEVRNVVEGSR
jgi:hypothetical protein